MPPHTPQLPRRTLAVTTALALAASVAHAQVRPAVNVDLPGRRVSLGIRLPGGLGATWSVGPRHSATSRPATHPGGHSVHAPAASTSAAHAAVMRRVLHTASAYIGVPYRWGGTSPTTGFDCSGFVQYAFARNGISLPRTSRAMAAVGDWLPARWEALAPGDLVMFNEQEGEPISHVALYAGNRRILHSSSSGHGVRYDDLDTRRGRWFAARIVAARRVTSEGAALVREMLADPALRARLLDGPFDPPDQAPAP